MRIEQLMYLVDIAKTKSFSKTAQNFYITQQGASDAIKKLEKEFNVVLFNRTKQGVFLTEIGRSFVETAQEMVALYHTLEDKADTYRATTLAALDGEVEILAHPRIFQLLPSVIRLFRSHCPNARLRISECQSDEILKQVLSGTVPLGLVTLPEKNWRSAANPYAHYADQLTFEQLLVDDMVVCMSTTSPLKNLPALSSADLVKIPVVAYNTGLFGEAVGSDGTLFTSNNLETHKKLVAQNLAVDVMLRLEYEQLYADDPLFIAVPFTDDRITITLVTKTGVPLTPEAQYFAKLIRQYNYR